MSVNKIYSDDPLIRYKDTDLNPIRTKAQIDGVLAEYGTKDVWWHWEKEAIEKNESASIYVMFKVEEIIDGLPVKVGVKVECPIIWDKGNSRARIPENRTEKVNWRVSLRAMYWFIYTHLNSAYAMNSSKTLAFLGYIQSQSGKSLKDIIVPKLGEPEYAALELTEETKIQSETQQQNKFKTVEGEGHVS
jgi:hypothetical protein